jgi:sigma-E factor negative regulatory protein RseA
MSDRANSTLQSPLEELSAFSDGQLEPASAARVAAKWRDSEDARKAWHAYHLIGDVLRSEDLADATRDEAFLLALRGRLAQEPVVLAPASPVLGDEHVHIAPVAMAGGGGVARRRRWGAPVAVAAGFMAVAGALMVTRVAEQGAAPEGAALVANAGAGAQAVKPAELATVSSTRAATAPEPVLIVNGELVRDAQLDRYLSAHKQFGGNTALGVPSGFLRSATYEAPSR